MSFSSDPTPASRYLLVPERLLRACAHDVLAIGVYLAIARCVSAGRGPVPISAADLAAWEGGAHGRASTIRRIRRLLAEGWLLARRGGETKLTLIALWRPGTVESAFPWRFDHPQLGRPPDARVRKIPLDLFDVYLGRLDVQPGRRGAIITRYFDAPLLDLADIGAYAAAQAVGVTPTPRLAMLALVRDGETQPPQPLADLLAAAHAGALQHRDGTSVRLSVFGARQLPSRGESRSVRESSSESPSESPSEPPSESAGRHSRSFVYPAPERPKPRRCELPAPYAWDSGDSSTDRGTPPAAPHGRHGGRRTPSGVAERGETAATAQLRAMGVRHPEMLTDADPALVAAWQIALTHPGLAARFADPVAFAVTQLRRGAQPPDTATLDRWRQTSPEGGRIAPVEPAPDGAHAQLVSRARALAPDAPPEKLAQLVRALAAGQSDEDALAAITTDIAADQEAYRALIARTARR